MSGKARAFRRKGGSAGRSDEESARLMSSNAPNATRFIGCPRDEGAAQGLKTEEDDAFGFLSRVLKTKRPFNTIQ